MGRSSFSWICSAVAAGVLNAEEARVSTPSYQKTFSCLVLVVLIMISAKQASAQKKLDADSRMASLPATQEIDPSRWEPILIASPSTIEVPSAEPLTSAEVRSELQELRRNLLSATPHQNALVRKWVTPNQGKQWRALLDDLSLHNIAGAPSTLRLYAALHIAIADAEVAARNRQTFYRRPHPMEMDSGIQPLVPSLSPFAYPSDLAAETGAAERILLFARPEAAGRINALAEESMRALASSGLYLPSDCEAGRNLGILVAEQVLSVFERDGRPSQLVFAKEMPWEQAEAPETVRAGARFQFVHTSYEDSVKWTAPQERQGVTYGDLPPWNQTLPVDPTAGHWKPLILESADIFHAPPPAANSSARTMQEMEEIATALNNRTCYTDYIVFKWANEQPGRWSAQIMDELMERYGWDAPTTARAEGILYAAMYDALLTTWHEKFRHLRPRPALLELTLPTVMLTPKHLVPFRARNLCRCRGRCTETLFSGGRVRIRLPRFRS